MQKTLEEAFHATGETVIDVEFWNRFVLELAARFRGLENIKISWEEVSRLGIDVALARINNAIAPAAERVQRITELGFLVASSDTPATLSPGQRVDLIVTAGDARDLFTPSPFLFIGRAATADDYAVARLVGYNRESGLLELLIVSVAGAPGPHSDWSIGAVAGSTIAQLMMLEEGRELAATVIPAVTLALEARERAEVAAGNAEASRAAAKLLYDATVEAARPLTSERVFAAIAWIRKTANYAAKSGDRIFADTSAGPFAITLPASGEVEVQDAAGTWATKNLTIIPGAKPIRGCVGNLVCDQAARLAFTFDATADVWTVTRAKGVSL